MPEVTLYDQVTDYIFRYIHDNQLKLGDKLPSEIKTGAELKISRGIVREAFRALRAAGIIEVGNGRSPRVGVLSNSFLTHLLLHALSTQQVSPEQVLDLRASIEVRAAELAAKKRTDAMVKELHASVRRMKKSLTVPADFVAQDMRFHEIINGASENPLVEIIGGAMHECMAESMRAGLLRRTSKAAVLEIVDAHAAIAEAIEKQSAPRAGALMRRHFDEAKKALIENQAS